MACAAPRKMKRLPATRRHAERASEKPRHMALIGEAASLRRIGERTSDADQVSRLIEAPHREIAIGAGAEPRPEMAGERIAGETGQRLEFLGGDDALEMRVEEFSRPLDRPRAGRAERSARGRGIERQQGLRDGEQNLIHLQSFQGALEIVERRKQGAQQARIG